MRYPLSDSRCDSFKRRFFLTLQMFFLLSSCTWAESIMETYYLGLSPKAKFKIIEDMLNSEGKIVWLNSHSIFVKDEAEVHEKINQLLSQEIALPKRQVRISLKKNQSSEEDRLLSDAGIKISPRQGAKITWRGGNYHKKTSGTQVAQMVVLSGKSASLKIKKTQNQLLVYRKIFLEARVEKVVVDGVSLVVKPVISGSNVLLLVQAKYWALIGSKREFFDTQELSTKILLRPGRWMDIGGSIRSSDSSGRTNIFQSIKNRSSEESLSYKVKAEIIKI